MCNLSLGVEERGFQKGVSKTINNYIDFRRRSHTSVEEIKKDLNEIFKLNQDEIEKYISSLKN